MEYYGATKRKHWNLTMWMKMRRILLNERSQLHNFLYDIAFIWLPRKYKRIGTEVRLVAVRSWSLGKGLALKVHREFTWLVIVGKWLTVSDMLNYNASVSCMAIKPQKITAAKNKNLLYIHSKPPEFMSQTWQCWVWEAAFGVSVQDMGSYSAGAQLCWFLGSPLWSDSGNDKQKPTLMAGWNCSSFCWVIASVQDVAAHTEAMWP